MTDVPSPPAAVTRRRRAGSAPPAAASSAVDRAAEKVAAFVRDQVLRDSGLRDEVAREVIEREEALGNIIRTRDLRVAGGKFQMVPLAKLEALRTELDDLRVAVAEHLDGGGNESHLRELLEGSVLDDILELDTDDDTAPEAPDASPDASPDADADGDSDSGPPADAGSPGDDEDADRRPREMPSEADQPIACTHDDCDVTDVDLATARISWTRWRTVYCLPHHKQAVQASRASRENPAPEPEPAEVEEATEAEEPS